MSQAQQLITEHIDIWTSAIVAKSGVGRGSSKKRELYGIKKLRELILELAVRGKLVPQDSSDEPASVLLERMAVDKATLVKEGKIKKIKPLPAITEDENPFDLPSGWECYRLGELITKLGSGSTPRGGKSAYVSNGIPFLRSQNVWNEGLNLGDIAYINDETHERMDNTIVYPGDILLNITGASLGRSVVFPDTYPEANVSQHVTIIRLVNPNMTPFMHLCIRSPLIQKIVWGRQVGMAIEGLSKKVLELFEMPIAPLAEQHRIVAKVDELMLLCDKLEQQTESSIDAHATLVEVLLSTLTDSDDADELTQNWARVAEHFDTLFTTEQSIDALKQTILQLAVMGKLVPQNLDDEPASVLLEKIAADKAILVKEKKIKKEKSLPPISDDEKLFELPTGWEWCRLDNLSLSSEAGWSPQCEPSPRDGDTWGVLKVSAVTWGVFNPKENKALPSALEPRPQYEVKGGDFLISRANTAELVARAVVVPAESPKRLMMSDKIIRFSFSKQILSNYINLANNSRYSRGYYAAVAGGTSSSMKNVSRNQVRSLAIALPPFDEQHRIVAKVDEMNALCDQLKDKLQQSQQTQVHLTDALIENALV